MKKEGLPISYEFLLGLLNSSLFWFYIQKTGYVLRGGYYTFKTNYVAPFPFPNYSNLPADIVYSIESLVKDITKKKKMDGVETTHIEIELDQQICKLYDIDYDAVCSALSEKWSGTFHNAYLVNI